MLTEGAAQLATDDAAKASTGSKRSLNCLLPGIIPIYFRKTGSLIKSGGRVDAPGVDMGDLSPQAGQPAQPFVEQCCGQTPPLVVRVAAHRLEETQLGGWIVPNQGKGGQAPVRGYGDQVEIRPIGGR